MPDQTLVQTLLSKLGLNTPTTPNVDPKTQALYDELAKRQQANDPSWMKVGRDAIDKGVGFTKGYLGIGDQGPAGPTATNLGQVLAAGLPFAALRGEAGPVFHGTQSTFERFNPAKNDTRDVLGWATHFAEDPTYAEQYATGGMKQRYNEHGANMISAVPDAKNVLDLTNPNGQDISTALGALDPVTRKAAISRARDKADYYTGTENPFLKGIAYEVRNRLGPAEMQKTPFDAIRYNDMGEKVYAVPPTTPIHTPAGLPLHPDLTDSLKYRSRFEVDPSGVAQKVGPPASNEVWRVTHKPSGELFHFPDYDKAWKFALGDQPISKLGEYVIEGPPLRAPTPAHELPSYKSSPYPPDDSAF